MKKRILALGLTTLVLSGYAQSIPDPGLVDTLDLEVIGEDEPILPNSYDDSLARFVPAYDIYCSWDTVNIHPYKFEMEKFSDSLIICLLTEDCDYYHPFKGHKTSDFGSRRSQYHYGVDIDLELGDTVRCAFEGRVRISKFSKSYGHVVIVRHNNGLETTYAHLSKRLVTPDQYVQAGDILGLGGNTGHSFGSHLHFEVRYKGSPINPNTLIDFNGYKVLSPNFVIEKKTFKYLIDAKSAKYHTIKKGDTLGKIAKRYGTSVKALCKLNKITPKTILRTGRKLRVK
jgi:murein DD-endopeptidase MepM/ murein hydrolase activator NlpD